MKVLVSANHPGGANAVLPVVQSLLLQSADLTVILEGRATDIFRSVGINFLSGADLTDSQIEKLFNNQTFDIFLAGTSLGQTIDKKLLSVCRARGIVSVYILDFWSNYWARFSQKIKDLESLPDYICVMDDFTKEEMVAEGFPKDKLVVTGNPHFDSFTEGIDDNPKQDRILFVSQPFVADQETLAQFYNEEQILEEVLDCIPPEFKVAIRLHPREEKNKFDRLITRYHNVEYDEIADLKKSLSTSKLIIGINSMVLFQAAMAGKKVISYQPGLDSKDDVLVSNRFGLSWLATSQTDLKRLVNNYFTGQLVSKSSDRSGIIVPEATKNVINFIYNLKSNA